MRKLYWLIPLSFVLYACPYESAVPLEPRPVEQVDSSLLGYWYGIVKDGSDFFGIEALDISRQSDSVYNIIRYGKAAKGDIILPDTAYFTGYTSYIGNERYMNVCGTAVTIDGRQTNANAETQRIFYLANFKVHRDTMDMRTIIENFSPRRSAFTKPEDLKTTVVGLLDQQQNIFDELYSLSYHRIPRPLR